MTPEERDELKLRWHECEQQIQAIQVGRVVRGGSPADAEAQLLEEQDIIEYELGLDEMRGPADADTDA
jgi:hypothetical protein